MARETLTRLTFEDSIGQYPVWTPDGRRIAFSGQPDVLWKAADGSGNVERLSENATIGSPTAFSPDGKRIVMQPNNPQTGNDLSMLNLEDGSVSPLLATRANERNADISPDGRLVAYESDESGRYEVYVRPFPDVEEGRWQVSSDGGARPLWARNGRELFYMNELGQVMAVPVQTEPTFVPGNAEVVVTGPYFAGPPFGRPYDVSSNGQRFLMNREEDSGGDESAELIYVQNWVEELKQLVPAGR